MANRIPVGERVKIDVTSDQYGYIKDEGFGIVKSYYKSGENFGYNIIKDDGTKQGFYFKFVRKLTKLEKALK